MHLEYIAVGVPISNQSAGTPALLAWRAAVEAEARRNWNTVPLTGNLKVVIINFHTGDKPSLDLDNMSKPISDAMQKIVYENSDFLFREEYAISTDIPSFFEEQGPALDRLSRDFAGALVSTLLENF